MLVGFRELGYLAGEQMGALWGATKTRLRVFGGTELVAVAEALVRLRQEMPPKTFDDRLELLTSRLRSSAKTLSFEALAGAAKVWAMLGRRDWPLLSKLADAMRRRLEEPQTLLQVHPDELSKVLYAFVKLGAPELVDQRGRSRVCGLLQRLLLVLEDPRVPLASLGELGLRRMLLSLVLWGPPPQAQPPSPDEGMEALLDLDFHEASSSTARFEEEVLPLRRRLLVQGLVALLPDIAAKPAPPSDVELEQLRLVAASARVEFCVRPGELSPAAAAALLALTEPPAATAAASPPPLRPLPSDAAIGVAKDDIVGAVAPGKRRRRMAGLNGYEQGVVAALDRVLIGGALDSRCSANGAPPAEVATFFPSMLGDLRVALPAWRTTVEVGLAVDYFEDGDRPRYRGLTEGPAPRGPDQWQRQPALRMRLLHALGWHVVQVPFWEWQKLMRHAARESDHLAPQLHEALHTLPRRTQLVAVEERARLGRERPDARLLPAEAPQGTADGDAVATAAGGGGGRLSGRRRAAA